MRKFFKELRCIVHTAFKYNLIKGAAVIKVIQAILVLSGTQPWTPEQSASVETLIDSAVAVFVLVAMSHAHDAQPNT